MVNSGLIRSFKKKRERAILLRLIRQSAIAVVLKALVEVDWARSVQASIPKLANPTYRRTALSKYLKKRVRRFHAGNYY
jgi:hypothetical protein